jgi:hypothetical protein
MDLLLTAKPFELAIPGSWSGFFGNLYPAYFRGLAHLSARHGSAAARNLEGSKPLGHYVQRSGGIAGASLTRPRLGGRRQGERKGRLPSLPHALEGC